MPLSQQKVTARCRLSMPPPPQDIAVDFRVCRATLSKFFLKRTDTNQQGYDTYWSLQQNLPRKGN